jgi:putative hemolysin
MKETDSRSEPPLKRRRKSQKNSKREEQAIPTRRWASRLLIIALIGGLFAWFAFGQGSSTESASSGLSPSTSILIIFLLLVGNAIFACAEIALITIRHSSVRMLYDKKHRLAPAIERLKREPTRFLSIVQVGVTFLGFLQSAIAATNLAGPLYELLKPLEQSTGLPMRGTSVVLVTLIAGFVNIVMGEIVPKSIGVAYPERAALFLAGPMLLFDRIFALPVWFINLTTKLLLKPFGVQAQHSAPIVSEEELKILVEAGEEQGVLQEDEKEMIHSIFDFTDTIAREIMTPRVDMHSVDVNTSPQEVVRMITRTGHSRIPVYENSIDNIIGIVHVKDLLRICEGRGQFHLQEILRPPYFVPENKKVGELLEELRRQRVHMAIVQDEYGGTAGIVTLEDLVEEIVGEIQDEYDPEQVVPVLEQPDGSYLVDASLHLDDVNDLMDTDLQSEEFDTLGGYVFGLLGHQPQQGESVQSGEWQFTVQELEGHRIRFVSLNRVGSETDRNGVNDRE